MVQILYVILGVVAGFLSGMLGIGGGLVLIPALVFIFGLTQLQAQGTTLALMIPPIGLLAAIRYYQSGNVDLGEENQPTWFNYNLVEWFEALPERDQAIYDEALRRLDEFNRSEMP